MEGATATAESGKALAQANGGAPGDGAVGGAAIATATSADGGAAVAAATGGEARVY